MTRAKLQQRTCSRHLVGLVHLSMPSQIILHAIKLALPLLVPSVISVDNRAVEDQLLVKLSYLGLGVKLTWTISGPPDIAPTPTQRRSSLKSRMVQISCPRGACTPEVCTATFTMCSPGMLLFPFRHYSDGLRY